MRSRTSHDPLPAHLVNHAPLTPLTELTAIGRHMRGLAGGLDAGPCRIFAKLESCNPTGSIKDRIAGPMLALAEHRGVLKPGITIVEASSGNTTLALASVLAGKPYKLLAFVPASMTEEKFIAHRAMGVPTQVFTPDPSRPHTNIRRDAALDLAEREPDTYVTLDQFTNAGNRLGHELATGPQLAQQVRTWLAEDTEPATDRPAVDAYFGGAGTGGSFSGVVAALRARPGSEDMAAVLVDPEGSAIYDAFMGRKPKPGQLPAPDGTGERFVPGNLDLDLVTDAVRIDRPTALRGCGELRAACGILAGPCTGYALAAALDWCRAQTEPKNVALLVCDRGDAYLSDPEYAEAVMSQSTTAGVPAGA